MAKFRFEDSSIRDLPLPAAGNRIDYDVPGKKQNDKFVRGFAVRTTAAGAKTFLLVYVVPGTGRERRQVIGAYGTHTVTTARAAASQLRARVDRGEDPFAADKQQRAQEELEKARSKATLGGLLDAYVKQLKNAKKPSAKEVEDSIKRNLKDPFPKIAALPAHSITVDNIMPVLRRLTKAGSWRSAEKLRAYLRAAYAAARRARNDAAGFEFDGFVITSNPMEDLDVTRPKEAAEHAASAAVQRKWALSEEQLRAYWKRISAVKDPYGALLRFHLLTGGQRMEQLSRLARGDYDADRKTVTLRDTKGRRKAAREHVIPLIPDAVAALEAMGEGAYLFTVSKGESPAVPHTLAAEMREVSDAMRKAREIDRPITPGAIRRTVETRLAAKGVSDEVLARLLSHGLGGVQARNYNAHHYDDEKKGALQKLRRLLDPPKRGKVIEFPAKAG